MEWAHAKNLQHGVGNICLDESMLIWFSWWTCPGWVFCPCKPHPFGNEYHRACCGLLGILFVMELVEGNDQPIQVAERWCELGKTMGLLMWMLLSYFLVGQYVVLQLLCFIGSHWIEKGWLVCLHSHKKTLVLAGICSGQCNDQGLSGGLSWRFDCYLWHTGWQGVLLVGAKGAQLCDENDGNKRPATCKW